METGRLRIITHMVRSLLLFALFIAACHARYTFPPGGYNYPDHYADKDTCFYFCPVRYKLSRRDSFFDALDYDTWRAMDEPNLSLKPMPTPVFRFTYGGGLNGQLAIITLTPGELVAKQASPTEESKQLPDTSRLDPLERRLVALLDIRYPIDERRTGQSARSRHYLDSMGQRYPRLYDPGYYKALLDKEYAHTRPLYTYTTKRIKITPVQFDHFVSELNASGFWHMPPGCPCVGEINDGWGFTLEANTAAQYNMVQQCMCAADTTRFKHACEELVRYAGLEKEIAVYSDHPYKFRTVNPADLPPPAQLEAIPPKNRHHRTH